MTKLTDMTLFTLNNVEYFGNVIVDEEGVKITKAIKSEENLKETAKKWLKANNLNELINMEVTGLNTLAKTTFNESDILLLDSIDSQAAYVTKYAVAKLKNVEIDNI